jgi:putative PIN family toxin of toxin-antitoxin system
MLKVVLDANQYASALIKPGSNSARLIEFVYEGHFALVISAPIIDEVRRILSYPKLHKLHDRSIDEIDLFLKKLEKIAIVTPARLTVEAVKDDPTDNKYLACAIEGQADFIVSGDHHLTDLAEFRGIRIVSPATFLKAITQKADT